MLFFGVLALLGNLDIKHVGVIFIVLGFFRYNYDIKTIELLSCLPLKSKSVTLNDLIFISFYI